LRPILHEHQSVLIRRKQDAAQRIVFRQHSCKELPRLFPTGGTGGFSEANAIGCCAPEVFNAIATASLDTISSLFNMIIIGGPGRDRTDDLFHAMEARSQLRHRPTCCGRIARKARPSYFRSPVRLSQTAVLLQKMKIKFFQLNLYRTLQQKRATPGSAAHRRVMQNCVVR
jgi:hypothetical protein